MSANKFQIVVFLALVLFSSCKNEVVQNTQIVVLIDITDERFKDDNFASENVPHLLKLMKLDNKTGGYSGGEIKFSLINEVSDSKSKTVKIEPAKTGLMGENPLNRKDKVNRFNTELKNSFDKIVKSADWGTNASKIYQKISRECIKMKRGKFDRRYLIIYSDMLENSNLFSFYGSGWKTKIQEMALTPETTLQKLAIKGPALPDLSDFEISIITTRTPENDEKINLSEQFWTTLFEYQGATVYFGSELEI